MRSLKVLIVRFSSIGDIVLTSPVVRCLKQQLNEVEIHYLTKARYAKLINHNPYIDQCHFYEGNLLETIRELRQEGFDYLIDLHHNLRSFLVKQGVRVKSYNFRKLNIQKWILVNLKWDFLPRLHVVDRYMETVQPLGVENDGKGLDYFIPSHDEVQPSELPKRHRDGFIAFMIGGKFATKQLPVDKIMEICQRMEEPVILLGGEYDFALGNQVAKEIGNRVFNACGLLNINQSASLIKQAQKVITHDTSLMHVAAAFDKDTLSLWGNTVPAFGMSPYFRDNSTADSKIMEIKDLPCRPCSKIGYQNCPKGHFYCMVMQDEEEIIQWVNR